MVQYLEGRNCIGYHDFVSLLNEGGWKLRVKMKDKWDVTNHLEYLTGLYHSRANLTVIYAIDCSTLEKARNKKDVYIVFNNQDVDNPSAPKNTYSSLTTNQFFNYL